MDQPIIYPRYKTSRNDSRLYQRLYVALSNDEKDEFMRLIKDPGFEELRPSYGANKIFSKDALEIAIAVFNDETKGLIDMEDVLKDGMTPLHFTAMYSAPRLTKFLLERGDKVDAVCDHQKLNLELATPIDLSMCTIVTGCSQTLFDILWWVCTHNRVQMEIVRMLVRSKQNTTWHTQAFLNYAHKGELHNLAALFLAVPELFLSSPENGELSLLSKLDLELNSLENKTHDEKLLSLLLDVFALVGLKLAAYIRLEEFTVKYFKKKEVKQSHLEIDFFLREVARKKLGVPSPDYYLRFYEAVQQRQKSDDGDAKDGHQPDWDKCTTDLARKDLYSFFPYLLSRKDFERTDIYRLIPSLEREDAAHLTRAIEKKLSSESAFLKTSGKTSNISKTEEKQQSAGFPIVFCKSFEPNVRSYHTSTGSVNRVFDVKFTPNKVMQSSKLKSFFNFVKLSHFPLVAKRLLK